MQVFESPLLKRTRLFFVEDIIRLGLQWIWLVSFGGFGGPLRQYFGLYRAGTRIEGERNDRREKKMSEQGGGRVVQWY